MCPSWFISIHVLWSWRCDSSLAFWRVKCICFLPRTPHSFFFAGIHGQGSACLVTVGNIPLKHSMEGSENWWGGLGTRAVVDFVFCVFFLVKSESVTFQNRRSTVMWAFPTGIFSSCNFVCSFLHTLTWLYNFIMIGYSAQSQVTLSSVLMVCGNMSKTACSFQAVIPNLFWVITD